MHDTKKLLSNSLIVFVGTVITSAFSYLFNMLMGRILGPRAYGDMTTVMSAATIVLVAAGSVVTVVMMYTSELYAKKNITALKKLLKVFSRYLLVLSIILFLVLVSFSGLIADFFSISNKIYVVIGLSAVIVGFLISVNRGFLQGTQKFVPLTIINTLEMICRLALGMIIVKVGFGVGGAVLATVLATILAYVYSFLPIKKILSEKSIRDEEFAFDRKNILSFAVPTFMASLLISISLNVDILLVKHYFDPKQAGMYAAISTIGKIIFYLVGPIAGVMFPMIAEKRTRGEKHFKTMFLAMFLTAAASVLILTVYTVAPTFIIKLLYGNSYTALYSLLPQVGLFIMIYALVNLFCNYFMAIKDFAFIFFYIIVIIIQIELVNLYHSSISEVVKEFIISNGILFLLLLVYYLFTKRAQIVSVIRGEYERAS